MRALWSLLRARRGYVLAAAGVGIAGGVANARLIALVNDELANAGPGSQLAYLTLVAVAFATGLASETMLIQLSERLSHQMRLSLCGQILRLPLATLERTGKARLMAVLTQDIPVVGLALLRIPTVFINGAITLGCLAYLGFLSLLVLASFAGFLLIGLVSYVGPERRALRHLRASRQAWDELAAEFEAMNQGQKELKLNYRRRVHFFDALAKGPAERVRTTSAVQRVIYSALFLWAHALFFLFVAILLYAAPRFAALDAKTLTGFAIVTLYLVGPIDQLLNAAPRFRAAGVAFRKVEKLGLALTLEPEHPGPSLLEAGSDGEPMTSPKVHTLELRGVTHSYYREREERDFTLGPIDLALRAGELVLITGGNGSGKTTLAKILAGLYLPQSGQLLLDGEEITERNREHYRQAFAAVFTDFHVFTELPPSAGGTDVLDERALGYLRKLQLDHKVKVQDGRLSSTALSTGQRKRLALLAAYLEDRPIYLFDEWAADQDPEFKQVFYHDLLPELRARGKTVLAITHDDRYFGIADRIVHLRDGQLAPLPPHGESTRPQAPAEQPA